MSIRLRVSTRGCGGSALPSSSFSTTSASMLMPNAVCIAVNLYNWLRTVRGLASRFSSITRRIPWRSDSSRMSEMPSIRFSRTSSAIFS